jgi:ketosteroid isomerase-like protein
MLNRISRLLLIAAFMAGFACAAAAKSPTATTLGAWLDRYGAAWETRDAAAAGRLFSADASYLEMPFDAPKKGRAGIEEYWRGVTADQRDIHFESKVIAVNGSTGVAHWSAKFRLQSSGAAIELDGVFVLEFNDSGECTSLREWWHVRAPQ